MWILLISMQSIAYYNDVCFSISFFFIKSFISPLSLEYIFIRLKHATFCITFHVDMVCSTRFSRIIGLTNILITRHGPRGSNYNPVSKCVSHFGPWCDIIENRRQIRCKFGACWIADGMVVFTMTVSFERWIGTLHWEDDSPATAVASSRVLFPAWCMEDLLLGRGRVALSGSPL